MAMDHYNQPDKKQTTVPTPSALPYPPPFAPIFYLAKENKQKQINVNYWATGTGSCVEVLTADSLSSSSSSSSSEGDPAWASRNSSSGESMLFGGSVGGEGSLGVSVSSSGGWIGKKHVQR